MKGMILNIYPEGHPAFVGCVVSVVGTEYELFSIVNLDNGHTGLYNSREYDVENPIVSNIFDSGKIPPSE